ncbi:hypothetical protein [Cellulomonas sp. HZM]|uniref:hypothetical protein n=1 Tax=Cellulomonas sp. HZM TaxID=1454010 RepID=UPI0004936E0A|nr:hypothetical protein [Cellulomonas sp. HZM]
MTGAVTAMAVAAGLAGCTSDEPSATPTVDVPVSTSGASSTAGGAPSSEPASSAQTSSAPGSSAAPTGPGTVVSLVVRAPDAVTTVLDRDPAPAALEASRAVVVHAPVVVVAPAGDEAAQLTAASAAVRIGAPVLLRGGGVDDADLRTELGRVGAERALVVGSAKHAQLPVPVTEVPAGAGRDELAAATGAQFGDVRVAGRGNDAVAPVAGLAPDGTAVLVASKHAAEAAGAPAPSSSADPGAARLPEPGPRPVAPEGLVALTARDAPVAALATLRAAGVRVVDCAGGDPRATHATVAAISAAAPARVVALGSGFGAPDVLGARVATARTGVELPGGGQLVFPGGDGKRYVALYGTPGSKALGVLGEQGVAATVKRAARTAKPYRALTDATVVPTLEMIATIASAGKGDDGDYSRERSVRELRPLVDAAARAHQMVVLDLQPGRADFLDQAKRYQSLLELPNVGLALDPEWRLTKHQKPLQQIGSVKIGEVNRVVDWLADLTAEKHLPQKMLVLHQFSTRMIKDRSRLDVSHDELAIVVHVDGQGSQPAKAGTWKAIRAHAPHGVHWGWKNFYDEDHPMLSPKKTYAVRPQPDLVSYQ